MSEEQDSLPDLPIGGLSEITLRIPGECFFCETIAIPAALMKDADQLVVNWRAKVEDFLFQSLEEPSFSPYPSEQLAWGYHCCSQSGKAILFASPLARLKQLGWENLDLFRRVFPSFVSLFDHVRETACMEFLLHEDTLTLACFPDKSSVPNVLVSLPVDWENDENMEVVRSKLLSLVEVEKYSPADKVMLATEVVRLPDGFFEFDHHRMERETSNSSVPDKIRISADELWSHDLRAPEFKQAEKNKRMRARRRWKSMSFAAVSAIILLCCYLGVEIAGYKLLDRRAQSAKMADQVPLVLESQKLLEKLRQNKLGGIDPFGALGRVAVHRGGSPDNPDLWFSLAHFKTRSHVKLEGDGRNVESINTFLGKLELAKISRIRKGRSGEELRQIKSGKGKTSFEVEIDLLEEAARSPAPQSSTVILEKESPE